MALVDWLKNLPRPLGLFTSNDERGMLLLNACRQAGLVVPRDVAVLGVDNDEVVCQLASPELSSVVADAAGIGFQAARLLDRLMTQRSGETGVQLVGPQGVVARQSTDLAAARDKDVAAAVEFIQENAAGALSIETVVEQVGISRSLLQQKFRAQLGRTIHDVIVDERVARIKHLLETSDLTLTAVARRTGFVHVEYLSTVFKRQTGISPGEYRRRFHQCAGG